MRRHLLFHCWPRQDQLELLTWHSEWLQRYRHAFTGRRLLSFSLSEQTLAADECRSLFGAGYEYSFLANDAQRSESVSFRYQLTQLRNDTGIVFRAHAKGANYLPGHPRHQLSRDWSEAMYLSCLNNLRTVESSLAASPVAGPCRVDRLASQWLADAPWHFTGGFYWFRLDRLRECWSQLWSHPLRQNYYFVEILPSLLCPVANEAACLHWAASSDMYNQQTAKRCLAAIKSRDSRPVGF